MPRPLYIFKSIKKENALTTCDKIRKLLGDMLTVNGKVLNCLAQSLQLLTNKDRASRVDIHTVDLGVRLWNDLVVTSELTKQGIYLQAMMALRDALETIATIEYLHSFPNEAAAWWKAKTRKEMLHFSINTIKDKIEIGIELKETWDWLSSFIHANGTATPVYSADKPYYGHYLYLGGFYYPNTIELIYGLQLNLCIKFLEKMTHWYKDTPEFNDKLFKEINSSKDEFEAQKKHLKERVRLENKEVVDKVVSSRLSKDKVIGAIKFLDKS